MDVWFLVFFKQKTAYEMRISDWSSDVCSSDLSVLEQFVRWESAFADRTYMTQPGTDGSITNYSWGEVGDQARRMAAHLLSLNLPPKSTIAIVGKNSAPWIIADLAAWMAGFITVPLYPTIGAENALYVLDHSEAKLLLRSTAHTSEP